MPKKGENISKRKDGRYEARYVKERDEFGRILKYGSVYAKSYFEVKRKREEILKNLNSIDKKRNIYKKELISESIIQWLDTKISIKDSSYTNYYSIIYSKIIPFFENKTLSKIDEALILKFIKSLQEEKLGNKRIKDIMLILKQFLKYKSINIKFETPKIIKKKVITLNNNEIAVIESITKNSEDIKVFAILLDLFTGMRIGELCALQWKDIDFENKVIHISKTLIRVKNKDEISNKKTIVIADSPKTQSSIRDIPINENILSYLIKFKKNDDNYLLTGNKTFITPKQYYLFYQKFLKLNSIKKYSFHTLRHTFATRSLLCGIDIKTLSEILGHSSIKTTLDLYVHIKEEEKLLQINKLSFF